MQGLTEFYLRFLFSVLIFQLFLNQILSSHLYSRIVKTDYYVSVKSSNYCILSHHNTSPLTLNTNTQGHLVWCLTKYLLTLTCNFVFNLLCYVIKAGSLIVYFAQSHRLVMKMDKHQSKLKATHNFNSNSSYSNNFCGVKITDHSNSHTTPPWFMCMVFRWVPYTVGCVYQFVSWCFFCLHKWNSVFHMYAF